MAEPMESCSRSEQVSSPSRRALTAPEALDRCVKACLDTMSSAGAGVRAGDSQTVHQVRVAGRRLQSALAMFGKCDRAAYKLAKECEWLIDEFAPARELDVFIAKVIEPAIVDHVASRLARRVRRESLRRRGSAYRRAGAALSSSRCRALLSHVQRLARTAGRSSAGRIDAGEVAAKTLSAAFRKLGPRKSSMALARRSFTGSGCASSMCGMAPNWFATC